MKTRINRAFYKLRLLRFSRFYDLYLRLFRKKNFNKKKREFNFYKNLKIPNDGLVFDLGANIGDKSSIFSQLVGSVIAVEPDRYNYSLLQNRFLLRNNIKILNFAIGSREGQATFYIDVNGSPANTLSEKWKNILQNPKVNRWQKKLDFNSNYKVKLTTLNALIMENGIPQYIKIDVEGFEIEVLNGLNLPIEILSFEANFPEFREETLGCIERFQKLSEKATYNCINEEFSFFWDSNKSYKSICSWIQETDCKYFEVFCFGNLNDDYSISR